MAIKVRVREVLVILLATMVVALPCLFMYHKPSAERIQVILSSFNDLVRSVDKPKDSGEDIEAVGTNDKLLDHSPPIEALRTSKKPIDQSPPIEAVPRSQTPIDHSPPIEAVQRNQNPIDHSPPIEAVQRNQNPIDHSPPIEAVPRSQTPIDHSPPIEAVQRSHMPIDLSPPIEAGRPRDEPTYHSPQIDEDKVLQDLLARAATSDKTVIITTLNKAWAANNTMIDLYLESFHRGENTKQLLKHLVIVALDQTAYNRCRELHQHCFMLKTDGVDFAAVKPFMSEDFLKMMWRRMQFLKGLLEMGYSFVFSDADIVWFRDPFEHFARNTDFQISTDKFSGDPFSLQKPRPNCGYQYARSNARTIAMYKHWCGLGEKNPNIDEQTQLRNMLNDHEFLNMRVKIRFLDTAYFSGLCQKSNNMLKVVTLHANCCLGLENKLADLHLALDDWSAHKYEPVSKIGQRSKRLWRVPRACRGTMKSFRPSS